MAKAKAKANIASPIPGAPSLILPDAPEPKKKIDPQAAAAAFANAVKDATKPESAVNVDVDVPQRKIAGGKATWTGVMELPNGQGGVLAKFAVKTGKAVDDEKFERHMYHSAECRNRVTQGDYTCSGCGTKGLHRYNTVKGVESDGEVILISDEELAALVPQNEKTMRITEYVEALDIDPIYFEETEFLYPQEEKNKAAQLTFAVLGQMLRRTGKVAKGIRVKRGKEQYFVVRPYGNNGLTINLLRAEYEVRDASGLWQTVEVPGEMVEMLAAVVETPELTKPFTPAKRDQFLANANKLKASKKAGITPDCPTPEPEQKGTDDLLAALKAAMAAKGAAAGK
jgi:DNA end-binding protein Ku